MATYFQKRSGLVGYSAGGSGYTDKLVTQMMLYGCQQWGSDAFWPVHYYEAHWYAELETGEIRLTPDGSKCSVYEVHLHTSIESNTTFTEPIDAIVQMKGVGDSSWTTGGDDNGTISVTPSTCVGTGTAWSNTIGYGDGSTVAFTTPAPAEKSRVYVNDVLQTVNVEYSITGTKQITFYTAPTDSYSVKTYWTGQPRVLGYVAAGGYIQTSYGLHRIITVNTATKLSLDWYPPTTVSGTHLPAQQLSTGESEKVFGLRGTVDRMTLKVYLIPRTNPASVRFSKDIAVSVLFTPAGTRQLEE